MGFFDSEKQVTSSIPPYLEEFYKGRVMPRLDGMIDRPYAAYPNQRIQGFDPYEERAFGFAAENEANPEWRPYYGRATEMLEAGSQPYNAAMLGPEGEYNPSTLGGESGDYDRFSVGSGGYGDMMVGSRSGLTPDALSRYMSPYKSSVVDSAVSRIEENADRNALRDRARATRTGNLYSAGHGIIDAERDKNTSREIGDVTGRLMDEGYKTALGQFNTETDRDIGIQRGNVDRLLQARTGDVGRRMQAETSDVGARNRAVEFLMSQGLTREQANQQAANRASEFNRSQAMAGSKEMAAQGTQRQTLRNQDMANLRAAGLERRGMGQKNMDLAYQDFLEQRDWPLKNISQISQIAAGQPYSKTTTETSNPSMFNTLAGAGMTMASLFGKSGPFAGSFGFADGGMVPDIQGPRGPRGPALARPQKRKATMTPGRQDFGGLPPPVARRPGRSDIFA